MYSNDYAIYVDADFTIHTIRTGLLYDSAKYTNEKQHCCESTNTHVVGTLWTIIIAEAITAGLLEHQHNIAIVGESKLSIQSIVVVFGKSILLFCLLQFYLLSTCIRFKKNAV
jgi:hypothetical protein